MLYFFLFDTVTKQNYEFVTSLPDPNRPIRHVLLFDTFNELCMHAPKIRSLEFRRQGGSTELDGV